MKTTSNKTPSRFSNFIAFLSWLFTDKKKSIYAIDEDAEEKELHSLIQKEETNFANPSEESISKPDVVLTAKEIWMLDTVKSIDGWVSSSKLGDLYVRSHYPNIMKKGGSCYASKTLNKLVDKGLLIKNENSLYQYLP